MKYSIDKELFAKRLKQARENQHLTKKRLSELSGVSIVSLVDYEAGTKTPNLNSVFAIAKVLNASIDWLCGIQYPDVNDIEINTFEFPAGDFITGSANPTKRVLITTVKLLDNSLTERFFDHLDDNLIHHTHMCSFITEYSELKKAVKPEALNSRFFIQNKNQIVAKYMQYSVDDLFVVNTVSASGEND